MAVVERFTVFTLPHNSLYSFYSSRHQDLHNRAFSVSAAAAMWFSVRANVICALFISAVALVSILVSQNPGVD